MPITNTAKQSPLTHLMDALLLGNTPAIELSEKRGQQELTQSQLLPAQCTDETREALAAWGVVRGEPLPDDPLFCPATLPEGWTVEAAEHPMWSWLLDDKGRTRAKIFYKAAFYDRSAYIHWQPRFYYEFEVLEDVVHNRVVADGRVVHTETRSYVGGKESRNQYPAWGAAEAACKQWLDANYPGHADPVASWHLDVTHDTESQS